MIWNEGSEWNQDPVTHVVTHMIKDPVTQSHTHTIKDLILATQKRKKRKKRKKKRRKEEKKKRRKEEKKETNVPTGEIEEEHSVFCGWTTTINRSRLR